MISGSDFVEPVDPCVICHEELSKPPAGSIGNVVVKTTCGHRHHLECANNWYNHQQSKPIHERTCAMCVTSPSLPLEREDEAIIIDEDNKYCESLPVKACRTGNLQDLSKVLSDDPSVTQKKHYDVFTQECSTLENIAIKNKQHRVIQKLCDHERGLSSYVGLSALTQKEYNSKVISIISRQVRNDDREFWSQLGAGCVCAATIPAGILTSLLSGTTAYGLAKKLYPDYDEKNEAPPLPLSEIKGLIKDV